MTWFSAETVRAILAQKTGQRIFYIARRIRGKARLVPGFEHIAAIDDPWADEESLRAMETVKPLVRELYMALGADAFGKKNSIDGAPIVFEAVWLAVLNAWAKIHTPEGASLRIAYEHALRAPGAITMPIESEKLSRFVGMAYYLQLGQGEQPIVLPRDNIGKLLGCSPRFVTDLVEIACRMGIIIEVDRTYGPGHCKKYRFNMASPRYLAPDLHEGATLQ